MKKFGYFIGKHRHLVLILAVILLIPSAYAMSQVNINYDILTYLPDDLESVQGEVLLGEKFGSSNQGYLLFQGVEEYKVIEVEEKIEQIEGIKGVTSIRDIVDLSIPKEMLPKEIAEIFYKEDCIMLMVDFEGKAADPSTLTAIDEIRELLDDNAYFSGTAAVIKDTIDLSDKDKTKYIAVAVVFAIIVLGLTLKSTLIPLLFLVGIGMSIVYNLGTNLFLPDVSYITEAIAAVLQLGVTMDFSIFLYHRYEEERDNHTDHIEAMGFAINKTAASVSGAALTTIAGFLALSVMELTIGQNIGIVMAKGVLIGVISTLTITPSLILVFDKAIHRFQHKTLLPSFNKTANFVVKHHIILLVVAVALLVPAYIGNQNQEVYYKLDESLPQDMPSIEGLHMLKDTYDMTTTHFVVVDDSISRFEMDQMINRLEEVDGVSKVLAYEKLVGPMISGEFIPASAKESFEGEGYKKVIVNSLYGVATPEMTTQLEEVNTIVKSYDVESYITGEGALSEDLIELTDTDFKNVNVLSIGVVLIIIMLVFKSLSVPVLLVAVIEFAVMINMGIPYYTNTTIPFIAVIIIGCIQLGTTVDYAILMTTRFHEEVIRCGDKLESMRIAIESTSKSIVTSGLTFFVSTFSVAYISDIDLISSLSMMMGRGALISMFVIILVLPPVLMIFEGLISKTTFRWRRNTRKNENQQKFNELGYNQ